jgi:hypothetical protein
MALYLYSLLHTSMLCTFSDKNSVVYGGNLKERDHLGDLGVDGRIILTWIFGKWDVRIWTGSSWLRIGTGGGVL